MSAFTLTIALCSAAATAAVPSIEGAVTGVIDGNRLWVQPPGGQPVQVRLSGIEAPLLCQAWGPDARDALKGWLMFSTGPGRSVVVKPAGRAGADGLPATVLLAGVNINQRMVEDGHAWSQRVKWDQGPYVKQERVAHSLARGLHEAGGAVMPADFRRAHGPCAPTR